MTEKPARTMREYNAERRTRQCSPACSEQHTYTPPCELAPAETQKEGEEAGPTPAGTVDNPDRLRDQVAEALMAWAERNNAPQYAAMRRPDTVRQNAYSRATAVLAVPAIRGLAETRDALRVTEGDRDAADQEQQQMRAELARVREWLPALRRAVSSLPATCRYHGDQLDPDRPGYGREACCDTGIPARRRREAEQALAALDPQPQPPAA